MRATVAVLLVVVGVGWLARLAPPIVTTSDIAITELYTDLASHARLMVGPYSRFRWHHPGPLYFYLLVPGYVASGRAGAALYAEAVVINVAAVGVLVAMLLAMRRPLLAALAATAAIAFALRADGVAGSPWTAHIVVLPALALVGLCAAVADGRTRLIAAAAAVASFVVQTDIALGPPMLAVVMVALAAIAVRAARTRSVPYKDLAAACLVSAVAWILPILDAVLYRGGNIAALWRFFAEDAGAAHSTRESLAYWSYGLVGLARSDLRLPWGGPLDLSSAPWAVTAAVALLVALAARLVVAVRASESFDVWLGAVTLTGALASLWGLTRARGDILDHEIFWLVALGGWAAAFVAAGAIGSLQRKAPSWPGAERSLRRASAVLLICLTLLGAVQARSLIGQDEQNALAHNVEPVVLAMDSYFDREHTRAAIVDIVDVWAQAVPIVLRLRRLHRRVAVPPDYVYMFTDALAPSGYEDGWLTLRPGGRPPPDDGGAVLYDSYRIVVVAEPRRYPGSR